MELQQALLLISAGILAGFINTVAGGGSLITLPLMIFLGLDSIVANATNRVAIFFRIFSQSRALKAREYLFILMACTLDWPLFLVQ